MACERSVVSPIAKQANLSGDYRAAIEALWSVPLCAAQRPKWLKRPDWQALEAVIRLVREDAERGAITAAEALDIIGEALAAVTGRG